MHRPRRLLSIAHSYAVAFNRRLAQEMARVGGHDWNVTAVAPTFFRGDLRPIPFEHCPDEPCCSEVVPLYLTQRVHVMLYGSRLREILRAPWDLVHCWEEPFILAGGQVAWWTPRQAPLVYATFQNIDKNYPPPFRWIEHYALERAAGWIAFGQTVQQALAQRPGYAGRAQRVIPLGVDLERFHPDPRAGLRIRQKLGWADPRPPVVGFLGRFVPEKGLGLLMKTLERLTTPWRALFVGSGPLTQQLQAWSDRYVDRARVVTGVKHDQVPAYLNAMDVLCAPSQTTPRWREQLGRMLLEAFACGVAVIASDSGEIPYVVKDAGRIVGEHDEKGWVGALSELLENPSHRAQLAGRGLERARTVYAWPIIARRHLDFFDELLQS
jgi:glycosyltransferase involved in cell wall biosynthesis